MKKKEKRYGLLKGIILFILVAIVLTWLIPNGELNATGFITENALKRVGLNDIVWIIYYAIYFSIDKILFLLALGGLYGVAVKTSAYQKLVTSIASKLNKKVAVIVFSSIIAILSSVLTQTYAVLILVPFIISILNKMKLDKMTIFATTFGAMLVGVLGATYGTDGLLNFAEAIMGTEGSIHDTILATILVRAGILVFGLVLFNFFTLIHLNKQTKNEEGAEIFLTEEVKETKKANVIPLVVIGLLLFVLTIIGYMGWSNNFNINVFNEFYENINKVTIGENFFIFKDLLGSNMGALGAWDLFSITSIIILFTIVLGLAYRIKLDEFFDSFISGAKKMIKPILCIVGAFALLVVVYMSPYIATIVNKLLGLTDRFNLATMSLSSLLANIFHTDLGYTGFIFGGYLAQEFSDYINPIFVIFTSLYGFVQFFIPTSVILGIGLTSLKVKYTEWLKYIWKFLLGMLICLLVIFTLMTVI